MNRNLILLLVSSSVVILLLFYVLSFYGSTTNVYALDGGAIYIGNKDLSNLSGFGYRVLIVDSQGLFREDMQVLRGNNQLLLGYISLVRVTSEKYVDLLSSMNIIHSVSGEGLFIEFWRDEWLTILLGEINHVYSLGFDGIVLDNIDVYNYLLEAGFDWVRGRNLYMDMRRLVVDLIDYCRERYGDDFLIFLGFSDELGLLEDQYIYNNIDGVLFKGLWHELEDGRVVKICECDVKHIFSALDEAVAEGKVVVIVDPVENVSDAREFCSIAKLRGYIPIPQPASHWGFDAVPPNEYYG